MLELKDIRQKIDAIDSQLVALATQRLDLADDVARVKAATGGRIFDPERERQLLDRLANLAGEQHAQEIRSLYATVLTLSKARQSAYMRAASNSNQTPPNDGSTAAPAVAPSASPETDADDKAFGNFLKLKVFGASHAPAVGLELENFPKGFHVDMDALQHFMERRAPGRDRLSTGRHEDDIPQFLSGMDGCMTTGTTLKAIIPNKDMRPADYGAQPTIPRPGHADYTQWVQTGRIPTGGGNHSGRMTVPLCIAGGLCLQWLAKRCVTVTGKLLAAGGNNHNPDEAIQNAAQQGDSVGGIVEIQVDGLRPGLGGPLFQGLECRLAAAIFAIPGVKGVEFGGGFDLAARRGSQANDPFAWDGARVVTLGNNHGGLLGGITTGMPLKLKIAMKPTPSIFMEQNSVNLAEKTPATCAVQGRHDPCIARRAVPVAEAMTAFALADAMMADEAAHPRICLTLTEATLEQALAVLEKNAPFVDMCELRADFLEHEQLMTAEKFPALVGMPVILTLRRQQDGGRCRCTETLRESILAHLLESGQRPFDFVDLEDDFHSPKLEALARSRGTKIIRSLHDFNGPMVNVVQRARQMKGDSDDIPKLAFNVRHCADMERLFRETADFTAFPHIICAMGNMGQSSRILAAKTHSMLTYTSSEESLTKMDSIGHMTPHSLVKTYRFRSLTAQTELFAVTGWPLGHSLSPELNNAAFFQEGWPAVMVPLPAETAQEALKCAEALGVRGMAVTVPHKQDMLPLMTTLSKEAEAVHAVNTVLRTRDGWFGANTDVIGFRRALLAFLGQTDLQGCRVAILGAGGAADAVAYVVAELHGDACIFNRTLEKAHRLARRYGFKAAPLAKDSLALLNDYRQIIIQATSVGLSSRTDHPEDADPIPFFTFNGCEKLFDLIYSPRETPLMARARTAGCKAENGLAMLVEQAVEQRYLYKKLNM